MRCRETMDRTFLTLLASLAIALPLTAPPVAADMVVLGIVCAGPTYEGDGTITYNGNSGPTTGSWVDGAASEDDDCATGTSRGVGRTYTWSIAEGVVSGDSCTLSYVRDGETDPVDVGAGTGWVTPFDPNLLVVGDEYVSFGCSWGGGVVYFGVLEVG